MKACAHFEGELAITFVPKDEKDGKIEVLCEQRAAEFSTASYEDYPECGTVEEGASLRVNAAALFHRIERVRYAAEKGCLDRRPQSACVQFRKTAFFRWMDAAWPVTRSRIQFSPCHVCCWAMRSHI